MSFLLTGIVYQFLAGKPAAFLLQMYWYRPKMTEQSSACQPLANGWLFASVPIAIIITIVKIKLAAIPVNSI
jgi:hypothetical protein